MKLPGGAVVDKEQKEKIALFRFGVIAELVGRKDLQHGQREGKIRELAQREWEIPGSGRSRVSRSVIREWLRRYEQSGRKLESLFPKDRCDAGRPRSIDAETEQALAKLKGELGEVSLPVILKVARQRKLLPADFRASPQSVYRVFQRLGLNKSQPSGVDRRRFEVEYPNELWQSDCMHGPKVLVEGRLRKSYLFAAIDDHSRLIPHAQFYLRENLDSYRDCLIQALEKRGLPRKLYVDQGPAFRSEKLRYACACLGIALVYATPYTPEGKGNVEYMKM
jgi:putative transposase